MAQFSVYRNKNARTRADIPFLLNVQSDLLDHLDTRVVIPLAKAKSFGGPPSGTLQPIFKIGGERCILLAPMLAGISKTQFQWRLMRVARYAEAKNELGADAGSLRKNRFEILSALDVLISGV